MNNIETFENERASKYDQFVQAWIPNYDYFIGILPKLLNKQVNEELLVAGCGTGSEMKTFADANSQWRITGIDPSPEMVAQARQKLKEHKSVTLIDGLVKDLPKKPVFGAATLILVLHFLKDDGAKLDLLKDIAQRLQSKAPFILLDITGDQKQMQENLKILGQLLPQEMEEGDKLKRLKRIETELQYVSESRLSELLVQSGFEAPIRFFQSSVYMGWTTRKR